MKRIECPCCGNYPFACYEEAIFQICPICFWQYDETCHEPPTKISGANKISLNEARESYLKYGVSDIRFTNRVRKPLPEELPENN